MRRRCAFALVAVACAFALAAPSATAQVDITASCDPNCGPWKTANLTISWTVFPNWGQPGTKPVAGCVTQTLSTDTKGTPIWCSVQLVDGNGFVIGTGQESRIIRLDKTPPTVTGGSPSRAPDRNGWYRSPVRVDFHGDDRTSGVQACTAPSYAGPDSGAARVTGTCTDVAGNTSSVGALRLLYDSTGPEVTRGRALRKPDHGRWYNRPVRWRFRGSDALSGHARCPDVRYAGPDGRDAHVAGACSDHAGNVSARSFALRYDSTPPAPAGVRAVTGDRSIRLRIRAAGDVRRISVVRAPGLGGARDSTLYGGRPRSFTDRHVHNGRRYRYTVIARDRAANRSRTKIAAVPGARLLSPPAGAVLSAPPLLRWTPVRGADYYNVQLRRDGHKVLSLWPARPRLQLQPTWGFEGRVRRLIPAVYEWEVWPGFGPRSRARYGPRVGHRSFVIPTAPPAQ